MQFYLTRNSYFQNNSSWFAKLEGKFRVRVFLANSFLNVWTLVNKLFLTSHQACKDSTEIIVIEWKKE